MISKEEANERLQIIRSFVKTFRKELTIIGGVIGEESRNLMTCDDYIEVMNTLSDEEFIGNYLIALFDPMAISVYEKSLEEGFQLDLLISYFNIDLRNKIIERIKG